MGIYEPSDSPKIDIRWAKLVSAAMASCRHNSGFAVVELKVVVNGNSPTVWLEPTCLKIHPAKVANAQMTPAMAIALTAMLQ